MISEEIKIILADPPNSDNNPYAASFPNIGILYLVQYLRMKTNNIQTRYINATYKLSEHISIINQIKPHLYGISFSSPFKLTSYMHINTIKRIFPDILILCGGPHPTIDPEHVLLNSNADICCIGEGESVLLEIIDKLRNKLPLTAIPGTAYKDQNNKIFYIPRKKYFQNIDILNPPAWDLVTDFKVFHGCRKAKGKPSTAILASRGCPFKCVFCSNPVWRKPVRECQFRSPENIIGEVISLYKKGIREIYIRSDEMNLNINWAISVFKALAKLNLPDLYFQCNLRADKITEELVYSMKQAKCWLCHIGVESGCDRVLKGIKKGVKISEIINATKILKKYNIKVYAFAMLYQIWEKENRLEHETTLDVCKTLTFIISMRIRGMINYFSWGFATPYPGSELFKICNKYGLLINNQRKMRIITPHFITMKIPGISKFEMIFMRNIGILLQSVLFLFSFDSYNLNTIMVNLKHAIFKLKSLFNTD